MMVMYKYTYWLIHNSAFTQYTHKICDKKLEITVSVYVTWSNMQHKTHKFQKYIYAILTWCYVLYDTLMNCIITKQSSQKWSLYRCE